jgi:hypothetical protein
MADLRFKTPFTYICAGASQSGKTTHVFNTIKYRRELFDRCPDNIIYFYNQWQPSFAHFEQQNIVTEWVNALPTIDVLKEKTLAHREGNGSLVIIDDFVQHLNNDIADLFTVLCHADNINVILLTQNLFSKNPVFRTISLNATYISLFKNPRDNSQIGHFAKQFSPGNARYLVEAFQTCTKSAYSYMLFDHHQATPEMFRIRSNILPHEAPMILWVQKNKYT